MTTCRKETKGAFAELQALLSDLKGDFYRRQILDFMLPGDFFGFTARAKHAFAVEAIVEGTIVVRYPRRRLEMLADSDPEFGQLIREMAFETISRLQARILILGQMTALEKVSSFVVEMAERLSGGDRSRSSW